MFALLPYLLVKRYASLEWEMQKSIFTPDQVKFQELLRQVRKEAGLTQAELAGRLNTLQTIVSNFEIGERRLDVLELRQVCVALGVPLVKFVERLEEVLQGE